MTECWLCLGLEGIAIHNRWSAERGKPLWTAHALPPDETDHPHDGHEIRPCPACRTAQKVTS